MFSLTSICVGARIGRAQKRVLPSGNTLFVVSIALLHSYTLTLLPFTTCFAAGASSLCMKIPHAALEATSMTTTAKRRCVRSSLCVRFFMVTPNVRDVRFFTLQLFHILESLCNMFCTNRQAVQLCGAILKVEC